MRYRSTRSTGSVSAREAVLRGLASDGGLFMPLSFPPIAAELSRKDLAFPDIAARIAREFLAPDLRDDEIEAICRDAFDFPVPLVTVDGRIKVLELFHGPTLAFKDFGARFMARCMGSFLKTESKRTVLLVATSGDTGGAVAQGFHGVQGIQVYVLYPSGKVSPLQEKQFTTLGGNITALEVNGTFDDCQRIVKELFGDRELAGRFNLASANSINVARLIPQSFYYFEAARLLGGGEPPLFVTPSGNFGNLTAGIFAERMGLKVRRFAAATNINDTVPRYLTSGSFSPKPSKETLSNAMDVGNPSNFERLLDLFGSSLEEMKKRIEPVSCSDEETLREMRRCYEEHGYAADPHTAVGIHAARRLSYSGPIVVLGTAHPAKFGETVKRALGRELELPAALSRLLPLEKTAVTVEAKAAVIKGLIESAASR